MALTPNPSQAHRPLPMPNGARAILPCPARTSAADSLVASTRAASERRKACIAQRIVHGIFAVLWIERLGGVEAEGCCRCELGPLLLLSPERSHTLLKLRATRFSLI